MHDGARRGGGISTVTRCASSAVGRPAWSIMSCRTGGIRGCSGTRTTGRHCACGATTARQGQGSKWANVRALSWVAKGIGGGDFWAFGLKTAAPTVCKNSRVMT